MIAIYPRVVNAQPGSVKKRSVMATPAETHEAHSRSLITSSQGVSIQLKPPLAGFRQESISSVVLTRTEVQLCSSELKPILTIPIRVIEAIDVHQPIFTANYVTIEYNNLQGSSGRATVTFNRGGATEFADAFFRITEGRLEEEQGCQGQM